MRSDCFACRFGVAFDCLLVRIILEGHSVALCYDFIHMHVTLALRLRPSIQQSRNAEDHLFGERLLRATQACAVYPDRTEHDRKRKNEEKKIKKEA